MIVRVASFLMCALLFSCGSLAYGSSIFECRSFIARDDVDAAELDRSLRGAQRAVEQHLGYKEQFPGELTVEQFDAAIRHSEWLVSFYHAYNLIYRGRIDLVNSTLAVLMETIDRDSVAEAWKMLELFQYIDEFSTATAALPADVYLNLLDTIDREFKSSQTDAQRAQMQILASNVRLAFYKAHFGVVFGRLNDLDSALATIKEAQQQDGVFPPAFLDYLEGYTSMMSGKSLGDVEKLKDSEISFERALKTYDLDCNPRLAAQTNYYLMDVHKSIAQLSSIRRQVKQQVLAALENGRYARAYGGFLETPDLWRAIHRRSSEIFELAQQYEQIPQRRAQLEYLAKRSYELAVTF